MAAMRHAERKAEAMASWCTSTCEHRNTLYSTEIATDSEATTAIAGEVQKAEA